MATGRIEGDLLVTGTLICADFQPPNNSIGNSAVTSADPLLATKVKHQYSTLYAQNHGSVVAAQRRVIYYAFAAGDLTDISAGVSVACIGGATITIDLYKNGTTILSATIVLDNTNIAFADEQGAFSAAPYAIGDVFEVVVTVATGGGTLGQGLFVNLVTREGAN